MREVAILLAEGDGVLRVRAVRGFDRPDQIIGRLVPRGQGLVSEVASGAQPIVVRDVSSEPRYLAFWGSARREGSFAAFPIRHAGRVLGIVTVTRPPSEPLRDAEVRLLDAISAQAALAIRNAQLIDELRDLSTHDELTGLANRRLLQTRMTLEIERARRFSQRFAVVAVDIDHFKALNDRCGHPAGDAALQAIAEVLGASVRRVDMVARVGGEEFVVLLPRADAREAKRVAEKLRAQVAEARIAGGTGQPGGRVTISLGVAQYEPLLDSNGEVLLARADAALYEAKRAGRNRVAVSGGAGGAAVETAEA
jgi:diguanylate cyclase (GGDEF)-like protein